MVRAGRVARACSGRSGATRDNRRMPTSALTPRAAHAALGVLGSAAFVVVTAESLPIGLARTMAHSLHAPTDQIGLLVTFYAVIAGVTSIPAIRWTADSDRRTVVALSMAAYALASFMGAASPNLAVLFASRGLAAVAHGLFFAIASPAAVRVAPAGWSSRAVSRIALGASVAFVAGVPLITALGQFAGWRAAMASIGTIAAAIALALWLLLPPLPAHRQETTYDGRATESSLAALRSRGLQLILVVTAVLVSAHLATFTYLTTYLVDVLHVSEHRISILLAVFGGASVIGSAVAGRLCDRYPAATVVTGTGVVVVGFVLLAGAQHVSGLLIPAVVVWGLAFAVAAFATFMGSLRRGRGRAAETVTALHSITFQIGIVAGSGIGSLVVASGHVPWLPIGSAVAAGLGLVVAGAGGRAFRGPAPAAGSALPVDMPTGSG